MNNPRRGRGRSGRRPNIPTRSQNFDSNGPEGRVRGNAQQVYEKYQALARDALTAGDRVLAEAFQQHGEHYYRLMNDSTDPDSRPREQQNQQQNQQSRDERDEGDEDYRGDQRGDYRDEQRGERRGQERGQERGSERREERRPDERRSDDRRDERRSDDRRGDERPNGPDARPDGGRQPHRGSEAGAPEGRGQEAGSLERASQDDSRDSEPRESRLRDRFSRRNGEGILTRRRGDEPRETAVSNGGREAGAPEDEADAGLRKMLGDAPPARAEQAPAAAGSEEAGEAGEAAPAKPRRRRRTKAEIEADKAKSAE